LSLLCKELCPLGLEVDGVILCHHFASSSVVKGAQWLDGLL
jgi:hypothetical protein